MSDRIKYLSVFSSGLLLLALLVVICATPLGPFINHGAPTPEVAIFKSITPKQLINFRVRATQPVPGPYQAIIILYSSELEDKRHLLSIALVEKRRWGWYFASGAGGVVGEGADNGWIDNYSARLLNDTGQYFIIYGRTYSPKVQTIEVLLSYGKKVRTTITDGIYVSVVPDIPSQPAMDCGITRAFDANNRLLYETKPKSSFSVPGCPD